MTVVGGRKGEMERGGCISLNTGKCHIITTSVFDLVPGGVLTLH